MKFNVKSIPEINCQIMGNGMTEAAGKMLAEALGKKGEKRLLESYGITFKEDMTTTTNAGSYTTMLSTIIYDAAVKKIEDILELVVVNEDLIGKAGFGAMKIPKLMPTTAVVVAEGAVVGYFDDGFDSVTVTPRKVAVGTSITWEILKRGLSGFTKYILENAATAVTRKLASDICLGLAAGAGQTQTGGVTFNNVINAEAKVNGATASNGTPYAFLADALVINVTQFSTLQQTSDWKNTMYYANIKPGNEPIVNMPSRMFGNLKIIPTPFLTGATLAMIMDTQKAAMLVKESNLETFEGKLPGRPYDIEIVAMMSYEIAIMYSDAICKITA